MSEPRTSSLLPKAAWLLLPVPGLLTRSLGGEAADPGSCSPPLRRPAARPGTDA